MLSPGRHVRTRLYFTSESHIHSLVNLLRYGGLEDFGEKSEGVQEQWNRAMEFIGQVPELNYLKSGFEKGKNTHVLVRISNFIA